MITNPPWLALRPQLIAAGYTDGELRRSRNRDELGTVRRGAYVHAAEPRIGDGVVRHELLVRAGLACLGRPAVVSHASAAVLLGLPLWSVPLDRVHLTRSQRTGGRVAHDVHLHTAPLRPDEVVELGGIRITSMARTVVDLARSLPFEAAVVVADAAMRAGLDRGALAEATSRAAGWPGSPAARRVAAFADPRSESVGESRSRVAIHRAGLPPPTLQWDVWCGVDLAGRCDFGWPASAVAGEFDGRAKYGRLLRPGEDPGDVVFREKLREDAIRAQGIQVVRWTWRDLAGFEQTAAWVRRALAAGGHG